MSGETVVHHHHYHNHTSNDHHPSSYTSSAFKVSVQLGMASGVLAGTTAGGLTLLLGTPFAVASGPFAPLTFTALALTALVGGTQIGFETGATVGILCACVTLPAAVVLDVISTPFHSKPCTSLNCRTIEVKTPA